MGRAQIPQMFIFIMAALVIGATVFLGMKLINGMTSAACSANDAVFQKEVRSVIDEHAVFGSRDDAILRTPCDAVALCFVDSRSLGDAGFTGNDSTITAAVRTHTNTTVFLKGRDGTVPAAYDARILLGATAPSYDLCIPAVSGKFAFNAEGKGKTIIIREAQ